MPSANYDLLVEQGQDHRFVLVLENLNLVGYTAEMQIRKTIKADVVDLELSTTNLKLVIDELTNTIYILINDQDSFLLQNNSLYDLFIESSLGDRKRIINGKVVVAQAVTR
jgi:hypothetical protein